MSRIAVLIVSVVAVMGSPVHASLLTGDYFVQPIIYYGGSVINGLAVNGPTTKTVSYYNAPVGTEARANLATGSLKGYAETAGGSAATFVQPRMGDTIKVDNAANTNATFTLAVDGKIKSDPITPELNSTQQVSLDAFFAIYDIAAGADEINWACPFFGGCTTITNPISGPLGSDRLLLEFTNHETVIDLGIDHLLSATIPVTQEGQKFKIFANLLLISNRNANPGTTKLDFLNSAMLGIDLAAGASFTSASGVLLSVGPGTEPSAVPLPGTGWLFLAGLFGLASLRRRASRGLAPMSRHVHLGAGAA